jgi:propanediol dehydratase small subunit
MTQEQMLEQIVKQVMASMSSGSAASAPSDDVKVTDADYPLGEKRPELITSATGIPLKELTLDKVLDGTLKAEDLRINPKTLEL